MFDHLDYVVITVSDMPRSVAFYRDLLGLKLRFESGMWSEFDTGTTTLALHGGGARAESRENAAKLRAGTGSIAFEVPDVNHAVAELTARGVTFVMPPTLRGEGILLAICIDPDGLPIAIGQPVRTTKSS